MVLLPQTPPDARINKKSKMDAIKRKSRSNNVCVSASMHHSDAMAISLGIV